MQRVVQVHSNDRRIFFRIVIGPRRCYLVTADKYSLNPIFCEARRPCSCELWKIQGSYPYTINVELLELMLRQMRSFVTKLGLCDFDHQVQGSLVKL